MLIKECVYGWLGNMGHTLIIVVLDTVTYRSIYMQVWNNLPHNVKQTEDKEKFINRLCRLHSKYMWTFLSDSSNKSISS